MRRWSGLVWLEMLGRLGTGRAEDSVELTFDSGMKYFPFSGVRYTGITHSDRKV